MILTRRSWILRVLVLIHLVYQSSAIQCKSCEKTNPACLLAYDVETRDCPSDDDLCYSWFDRTKGEVGVQRGCISPTMTEYRLIRKMLGKKESECFKRVNGLDCFKLCSTDQCN